MNDTLELCRKLKELGWGSKEDGFQWTTIRGGEEIPNPSKAELTRELDKLTDYSKGRPIEEIPYAYEEQMALWIQLKLKEQNDKSSKVATA